MQVAVATAALIVSTGGVAQGLADPTRPPLELMGSVAAGAPAPTPLQSILLSPTRKGAIINGQYVPLGGAYGKAKLVAISATAVTLQTGKTMEVLQLYPSLDKRYSASGSEQKPEKAPTRP